MLEIDWYQNEWPWPFFRSRLRSCQPLRYIRNWICRKPLESWFIQKTTNRKWPMGNPMVAWPMTSRDPGRSNSWPNTLDERNISKQLEMLFRNNRLLLVLYSACSVTLAALDTIIVLTYYLLDSLLWGSTVGYPSDSLASCTYIVSQ